MRSLVPKLLFAVIPLAALVWTSAAIAAPAISGTFELGSELETNNKIIAGPEGNIWVTLDDMEKDVAEITPSGLIQEFDLGPEISRPAGIVAAAGKIWVPLKENGIASFNPSKPTEIKEFEILGLGSGAALGLGPDGDIWAGVKEKIFRISPADPKSAKEIAVPGITPVDIDAAGPLVAIADSNAEDARIVTFTTGATPTEKDYPINGGSQGVGGSPSGQIGFSEQVPKSKAVEEVGVITPPNPPFSTPQPDDPFGAAFGADEAFWIVRAGGAHGLARLTPKGELSLLGGFPAGLTPRQITAGPANTLWVTDEENMKKGVIVRISGLEPPVPATTTSPPSAKVVPVPAKPVPDTKLGKHPKKVVKAAGKKATVKFTFSSTVAGSTFQCKLVKQGAGKGKKAKASAFKSCRSPKVLRLAPGSYRFSVRAVADGQIDGSPVAGSFRVVRAPRHR
jgi:streptogramin lyase